MFLAIVGVLLYLGYADLAKDETTTQAVAMLVVGGMALILLLINLAVAPYETFNEISLAKAALEDRRKPRLQVILPSGGIASVSLDGNTTESYGGRRITNHTRWSDTAIYLLVTNLGETPAKRVRARVLWAARETDQEVFESSGIIESIELPWAKDDPDNNLTTEIMAEDTARIWVANVRQGGNLWVNRKELPIHYHRIFGDEGHHKMLIQIDSENVASTQVLLSIKTEKAQKPEGPNGIWEPKATVSMLGQGGPVLQHPDVPNRVKPKVQFNAENGIEPA